MDELFDIPLKVAALLAGGTTAVMSGLKSLLKGKGKELPVQYKLPTVAVIAFMGSMLWFQAQNSLTWANWAGVLTTTVVTVFIAVLWHNNQKGQRNRMRD